MGWSSTMVAILVSSGLIILFLGIVGEYVGRVLMSTNNAPQYVVRERRRMSGTKGGGWRS